MVKNTMLSIIDAEIWEACKVVHSYFEWMENQEIARKKERETGLKPLLSPSSFSTSQI